MKLLQLFRSFDIRPSSDHGARALPPATRRRFWSQAESLIWATRPGLVGSYRL